MGREFSFVAGGFEEGFFFLKGEAEESRESSGRLGRLSIALGSNGK